jgi:peptidoglycan/LPS O-acetylase OafA/YrhL
MPIEMHSRSRIPSLDGLRALSIAIVICAHVCGTINLQFPPYTHKISSFGAFGVKVFFVISGYLITKLLLAEEVRYGRISIGEFYLRRAFRIWPVAYAFILVVALLKSLGVLSLPPHNLLFAATFTMNHAAEGAWWTGHLWSLAVEEQFYLVWPLIFLLCRMRARVLICIWFILLSPAIRIGAYLYSPALFDSMQQSLLFLGNSIAIGCLLALLEPRLLRSPALNAIMRSKWFFAVPFSAVLMYGISVSNLGNSYYVAGDSICVLCIGATMWRVVHCQDFAFKILNTSFLMLIGRLSYSLYIWQQLFLNRDSTAWINWFPQNLVAAIAVSVLSYQLIELPFLRLRSRVPWVRRRIPIASSGQTGPHDSERVIAEPADVLTNR